MTNDFLNEKELAELGFAVLGRDVKISRHAVLLSPEHICIGDRSRVDAFCVLSASNRGLVIGRHVHVSAHCAILGQDRVEIEDYASVSARCSIFTSNDDYSGVAMTNPTVPFSHRVTTSGLVRIQSHAILGSGAVILPKVTIGESAAVGALSLVKQDVPAFAIAAGVPARVIGSRSQSHRDLADRIKQDCTPGAEGGYAAN